MISNHKGTKIRFCHAYITPCVACFVSGKLKGKVPGLSFAFVYHENSKVFYKLNKISLVTLP